MTVILLNYFRAEAKKTLVLTEFLHGFSQSPQTNSSITISSKSQLLAQVYKYIAFRFAWYIVMGDGKILLSIKFTTVLSFRISIYIFIYKEKGDFQAKWNQENVQWNLQQTMRTHFLLTPENLMGRKADFGIWFLRNCLSWSNGTWNIYSSSKDLSK